MSISLHLIEVIALVGFFLLLVVVAHILHGQLLIAIVELGHLFLCLKVAVKSEQLGPEVSDNFDLAKEHLVEAFSVLLYIGAWLVDLIEQLHLILDLADNLIDVCPV